MYANYPKQNKGINMLFLMIERKKGQEIEVKKITYLLKYYEVMTNQKFFSGVNLISLSKLYFPSILI